ncbi:MAG: universal stress protein [Anaerolineae bacterium]|nr:universal stress protein [Anaerolineae bacterium]
MTEDRPRHIICAVRGSPQSRATVTRAIELALVSQARLTFFYVVDAEFKGRATVGVALSRVYRELVQMAEFSMLILCDRAERKGVREVDYRIREGNVRKQLLKLASETGADTLVMGWPVRGPGRPTFKREKFESFVEELREVANPRLVLVPPPGEQQGAAL